MNKQTKIRLSLLTLLAFFVLAIASKPSKMVFKNADQWIPGDFNPHNTVLLVQIFDVSDKAQKNMETYMAEKYPYKYEFASLQTIKSKDGKYSDTKLYKYALMVTSHTINTRDQTGRSGPSYVGFDYNFYDRESGKNYPVTGKGSSYAIMTFKPVINSIVKKFE